MRKFLFLLFIFINSSRIVAQLGCVDCNQDSLVQHLKGSLSASDRLYTLVSLADMLVLPADPDSALHCIDQVLQLNAGLHLVNTRPHKLIRDGLILWKKNESDSAIAKFKDAISAFDEQRKIFGNNSLLNSIREFYNYVSAHEERLKFYEGKLRYYLENGPVENTAICYHGIAGYYYFKSDYNQAIGYYLRSAEIFKGFSSIGYSNEITVAGFMYSKWGNYRRALQYLQLADSLNKYADHAKGNLELDKTEIAKIYKLQNKCEQALEYGRQALSLTVRHPAPDREAIVCAEIGGIFLQMHQPDSAYTYLMRAAQIGDSNHLFIDGPSGPFECDYYLYQYYLQKNDLKNAEAHLLVAYVKALKVKSNELVLKYSRQLADYYAKNKEDQKALQYFQKYVTLNDSLNALQAPENIAQYEDDRKELQSREQIQNMKATEHSQKRNYLVVGFFFLLITIGLASRIQYIRKTRKQLQEQNRIIEKEKQRAEQSEKFKEQFLANMSHEIRTPMNAVMGMTNLLIDKNPRKDQFQYLDGIKKSSEMLLYIINDILDLSKVEAGKIELERIDFSLAEVIGQVYQTLQHKAEEKGIQLITRIDDKIPDVLIGDPVRLNQVLMNLTGNALKFTEKGSVQIIADSIDEPNDAFCILRLSLTDSGIGIPEDKLQSIFEMFTQAHASDTRRFGGTGLGLSISKQLVELMGGAIKVESKVDSGTTFSFVLRMEMGSDLRLQQRVSMEDEIDGSILNGLSILVVDDNEYNRIVATDTLKTKAEVDITTASDGREAVELLKEKDFDVVLMDVQMPGMDGFEATRYIRENLPSPKKEVPVLALTASVLKSDIDKCRKAGMNSYIPKPFKASQLIRGIAEVLQIEVRTIPRGPIGNSKPEPSMQNGSVTNLSYLTNFCEGDPERIRKYLGMFLKSAPVLIGNINTGLANNDLAGIASQVHGFKTEMVMMGMTGTKELAASIELLYNEGKETDQVKEKIEKFIGQVKSAVTELQSI
jgi:signal transduction histidine kinase/DNA-binding NarL/FixJ family response regulator